jgi:hypothetical protein
MTAQGQSRGDNPIIRITQLGNTVGSGLYAFVDVGVNPSAKRNPSPVNFWSATSGVPNQGSMWKGYLWAMIKKARDLLVGG